jgi:hypothetical protein
MLSIPKNYIVTIINSGCCGMAGSFGYEKEHYNISMTESSVGISAIAHLTPMLDYVDMDGALLLKNDVASGVKAENGNIIFSNLNGAGAYLYK